MSEVIFPFNQNNCLQEGQVVIDRMKLIEIEKKIVSLLTPSQCKILLPELRQLRYKSLNNYLKPYSCFAADLAARLGKQVNPIEVEGSDILVDPERYWPFLESLQYLFKGIIENGIEPIDERQAKGKEPCGNIKCSLKLVGNRLQLTISDDGKGFDINSLKDMAVSKGLYDAETVSKLSKDETISLIFKNIFSTADNNYGDSKTGFTDMAAVKDEISKIGGSVKVKSKIGVGTEFAFLLPYEGVSDLPKICATDILDPLIDTTKKFLIEHVGIPKEDFINFNISKRENFKLEKLAAFINMKGFLNGKIVISTDDRLTKKIVRSFVLQELTPEEENDYIEDVLAEFINIVLGGSVKRFTGLEDLIVIEPPIAVYSEGILIKYPGSEIWICDIETVCGNLCLCFAPEEGRVF